MKRAIGIVNLHDCPSLGKLTERRPLGAVTFLGRYGLIDFALSNLSNSDINKIEILVQTGLDSIRTHTQNGTAWIRNTKTGYLRSIINEQGLENKYTNTDINNLTSNIPPDVFNEEYVVLVSPQFLMSIDYRDVLRDHGEKKADITIVYTHSVGNSKYEGCDKLLLDKDGYVKRMVPNDGKENSDISVASYIFSRKVFIDMVEESTRMEGQQPTFRNLISTYVNNKLGVVNGYKHKGKVFPILNMEEYVKQSFKLLDYKNRLELFKADWPIYTTTHNTPPALYGPNSHVINSFVANGAVVNGTVKNSILSRDVIVEEGAVIEDSIVFTKSTIGSDVHLKKVVTDKYVTIRYVKQLSGDGNDYLIIGKKAAI